MRNLIIIAASCVFRSLYSECFRWCKYNVSLTRGGQPGEQASAEICRLNPWTIPGGFRGLEVVVILLEQAAAGKWHERGEQEGEAARDLEIEVKRFVRDDLAAGTHLAIVGEILSPGFLRDAVVKVPEAFSPIKIPRAQDARHISQKQDACYITGTHNQHVCN